MEAKKPFGRSLGDFVPLKPAEHKLLEACRIGDAAVLDDAVPQKSTNENSVRAEFVRFLLLGGDEQAPVHERGVNLEGAYVENALDLGGCSIPFDLVLVKCFFPEKINAQDARVVGVFSLAASHLAAGLEADRFKCAADVYLQDGFKVKGEVTLSGADIGGNLDCLGGSFEVEVGDALVADGINVKGDIYLGKGFSSKGEVRLLGAQIGGNLDCINGSFEVDKGNALLAEGVNVRGDVLLSKGFSSKGGVRLSGAQIGGDLSFSGGVFEVKTGEALNFDGANVARSVYLKNTVKGEVKLLGAHIGRDLDCECGNFKVQEGDALSLNNAVVRGRLRLLDLPHSVRINAAYADVGVLVDDATAWASGSTLNGFQYKSIGRESPTDGIYRSDWLRSQFDEKFRPQPWRQLQGVLRDMGCAEDAKLVGIAFEDHLRESGRKGKCPKDLCDFFRNPESAMAFFTHFAFGKLAGYSYRPFRLISYMFWVWVFCGASYWILALPPFNAIAPSDPLVFQNKRYQECSPDYYLKLGNWYLCEKLRSEYATFSPLAYSLDVMLPVVDLGLEKTWGAYIPSPKESWFKELFTHWTPGHVVRLITWFQILFGWVSSLLLVAIISGFSRRNDEG